MFLRLLILLNLFISINAMSEIDTLRFLGYQAPSSKSRSSVDQQLIERAGYYILKLDLVKLKDKDNMLKLSKEYAEFLKEYTQSENADIDNTMTAFHEYYVKNHKEEIINQFNKCVDTIKDKLKIGKKKAKTLTYLAIEDINKSVNITYVFL